MHNKQLRDYGIFQDMYKSLTKSQILKILEKMNKVRNFEIEIKKLYKEGKVPGPIYLGIGQESIASTLSMVIENPAIFTQHRGHSYYLSFGGNPQLLKDEILGLPSGLNGGYTGSGNFSSKTPLMLGHSGLIGEQAPLAVGYSFATNRPTICVLGDASVEEDYVYGAITFAVRKKLPILFVVEDNNLSILTTIDVRRTWKIHEVAIAMGMNQSIEIADNPWLIAHYARKFVKSGLPGLMNILTCRHLWHAGTGIDGFPSWDRLKETNREIQKLYECTT